jgi:heat shock protein HslJ
MIRALILAALPLLVACATPAEREQQEPLTKWTFVAIDGKPPRSDRNELAIYADRITATVGCNGMGGDLKIVPGQLKVGQLTSTEMYCADLMEQERAVAELLGASPGFFIEGNRMGIRSDKHMAELVKKRAD